jgi:very-short-patch-repair endonuclease
MANGRARSLRKRPTIAEQRLWDEPKLLRREGYHFRRQAPIGPYVVDFVCYSQRLVIEVDGVQHDLPAARSADARRDDDLHWRGFNVVRFQNGDVMEKLDGVVCEIWSLINPSSITGPSVDDDAQTFPPPLTPPRQGEGHAIGSKPAHAEDRSERSPLPRAPFKPSGSCLP